MKKVLMVATVPSMIGQFNMNNIQILQELGYEVHVACDFNDRSVWTDERVEKFKAQLEENDVKYFQVDFLRSPLKVWKHRKAYVQLKKLFEKNEYEFTHCHTPIASVICRLVAHKMKVKCIYTAHGFHFFKGAPLKNWVIYYPIEKFLSRWTDVLITITQEDYVFAQKKMDAKSVEYVPGVGLDISRFAKKNNEEEKKFDEFGMTSNDIILLSIGELNENKNHETVIRAIAEMQCKNMHYFIAGTGELESYLRDLSKMLQLEEQIHLLGYRKDIPDLLQGADFYIHPSKREGLSVSIMEAMVAGKPVICADIRGNRDLIIDGSGGMLVSKNCYRNALMNILSQQDRWLEMGTFNQRKVQKFSKDIVNQKMCLIYRVM